MRIAVILWELDIKGGTQRLALEVSGNLAKRGHTVDVYAYYYAPGNGYTDLMTGLSVHGIASERKTTGKGAVPHGFGAIGYFYRVYQKLISGFWKTDPKVRELAELVRAGGQYDVINVHDYTAYRIAPLLHNVRIVWTMNDIQRPPLAGKNPIHNWLFNSIQKILVRREIRNISAIAVLDERNKRLVREYYGRSAVVVRGGMDLDMFGGRSPIRTSRQKYQIFLSSIFFPHRRFEDMVDAAKLLAGEGRSDFHVRINGFPDRAPAYYASICERMTAAGLDPFFTIATGMSEQELKAAYLSADIFVFPNNNQTWGLAVFEAMLAGCPVIVSSGSGASEILTDEENGLIVPPCTPEAIASALRRLMNDPDLLARLSMNGPVFVKEHLSWSRYAEAMERLFLS